MIFKKKRIPAKTKFGPSPTYGTGTVSVPASCLTSTEGTIEFNFTPTASNGNAERFIVAVGSVSSYILLETSTSNVYRIYHRYNNGTIRVIETSIQLVNGVTKNHRITYSGTSLTYHIDGVLVGTTTFDGLPSLISLAITHFGNSIGLAAASGYFTGYRLSPIARTSSTLSIPKIDASTTFFRKYLGVI